MAWKDWTRTDKVVVTGVTIVCVVAIVVFSFAMWGPKRETPPSPPPTSSTSSTAPSPSPGPTYECTTATGLDCTKDLADKEAARDQAYADAEEAVRAYSAARDKAWQLKRTPQKLPADLATHLTEKMQQEELETLMDFDGIGIYFSGHVGIPKLAPAKKSPDWPTDRITLAVCFDATTQYILSRDDDSHIGTNERASGTVDLLLESGKWKVAETELKKVESC